MATPVRKNIPPKDSRGKKSVVSDGIKKGGLPSAAVYSLLFLVPALVFSNSINSNFLAFDDFDYIVNNPYIKSLSWESIKKIFSVLRHISVPGRILGLIS